MTLTDAGVGPTHRPTRRTTRFSRRLSVGPRLRELDGHSQSHCEDFLASPSHVQSRERPPGRSDSFGTVLTTQDPPLQPAQPPQPLNSRKKDRPSLTISAKRAPFCRMVQETDLCARFSSRSAPSSPFSEMAPMASQAQINANRRNAQNSTGPKTEGGKARARLNALKDRTHAKTVSAVLPQENAIELEQRINRWIADLNPRNDVERELVIRAAKLSWTLDRAGRCETARLAHRVRKAQLKATKRRIKEVGELGRRLLYNSGPRILPTSGPPWEDNPAAFLSELEASAEGCGWLLDRWGEINSMLTRPSAWTYGDLFRLIRLQGKYPVEAIYDQQLNTLFLALDVITPGAAELFWNECKRCKPRHDPGFSDFWRWREIADRPADPKQALLFIQELVCDQVARVSELLAVHEEIAGDEAAELADRASCDGSNAGERLRRMQTARGRELRQTLELLTKIQEAESNEQAAGDGGKVKGSDNDVTELPAPAVAAAGGEQREAGSAARPASKKRPSDKYRSAAALEMVMEQRLSEQAFETCFSDPTEVLAAVMGSPRLADLKVQPGCAPVRASGAGTSAATSENHMKKSRIEANGDETQVEKRLKDNIRATDSGDGNRTQMRDEDFLGHG
jgi:hypothetical protein